MLQCWVKKASEDLVSQFMPCYMHVYTSRVIHDPYGSVVSKYIHVHVLIHVHLCIRLVALPCIPYCGLFRGCTFSCVKSLLFMITIFVMTTPDENESTKVQNPPLAF